VKRSFVSALRVSTLILLGAITGAALDNRGKQDKSPQQTSTERAAATVVQTISRAPIATARGNFSIAYIRNSDSAGVRSNSAAIMPDSSGSQVVRGQYANG
jgi:hypothetical protein